MAFLTLICKPSKRWTFKDPFVSMMWKSELAGPGSAGISFTFPYLKTKEETIEFLEQLEEVKTKLNEFLVTLEEHKNG